VSELMLGQTQILGEIEDFDGASSARLNEHLRKVARALNAAQILNLNSRKLYYN
jgi:hypothetical protein